MKSFKAMAHIHSLGGAMDEITILDRRQDSAQTVYILGTLYNEDGTEYKAAKPATKILPLPSTTATDTPTTPAPKPKEGQMSMFDLFDEPEMETEQTAEADEYGEDEVATDTYEEAPESPVEDVEPVVEQVPTVEVIELEKPLIEHINGLDVDTATGEIIEPEQAPDPYADTELMYNIYLLLDQKVEIVK